MNRGDAIESAMKIPGRAHMPTREEMEYLWDLACTIKTESPHVVEVGSWFGRSSWVLAHAIGSQGSLDCIDPCDAHGIENATRYESSMQGFHLRCLATAINGFDDTATVRLIKGMSPAASHGFKGCSLDMVWLDGDHAFETVQAELKQWSPKLRCGGILCGHDYGETLCEGVQRAVDESGLTIARTGSVWSARV